MTEYNKDHELWFRDAVSNNPGLTANAYVNNFLQTEPFDDDARISLERSMAKKIFEKMRRRKINDPEKTCIGIPPTEGQPEYIFVLMADVVQQQLERSLNRRYSTEVERGGGRILADIAHVAKPPRKWVQLHLNFDVGKLRGLIGDG